MAERHVSDNELDRAVAGLVKAMDRGFEGVHHRFDELREDQREQGRRIDALSALVGRHEGVIEGLRKPDATTTTTTTVAAVTQQTISDDARLGIAVHEAAKRVPWMWKAVWPALAALGAWLAAHWKAQP